MTAHESFKRRIRARMAVTGERYGAARRRLLAASASAATPTWESPPEVGAEAVRAGTGRGWGEWVEVLDAFESRDHAVMVRHLVDDHRMEYWWAQTVVVGFERIRGLRMPHQMADGTFTASRSRTMTTDAAGLRSMLLDADGRSALFSGFEVVLRSKPSSKNVRVDLGEGVAEIAIVDLGDGRARITVRHAKLVSFDRVEPWKAFWGEWLATLADSA